MKENRRNGFTIVELLIVIVVIAILAVITIVAYNGVQARARDSQLQSVANSWIKALRLYHVDHGSYPSSSQLMDQSWDSSNMVGVTSGMYTTSISGAASALISQDPVTSSLNDTGNYFKTGFINYRGSDSYWLNADGTFADNSTAVCGSGSPCNTYVLVYRLSDGSLKYAYGN